MNFCLTIPAHRERLKKLIDATYQNSLDCPKLNDVRDMEAVLEGYQSSGVFWPELWSIVQFDGQDVGCLLLADHPEYDNVELVYMGVAPEHARPRVGNGNRPICPMADALPRPRPTGGGRRCRESAGDCHVFGRGISRVGPAQSVFLEKKYRKIAHNLAISRACASGSSFATLFTAQSLSGLSRPRRQSAWHGAIEQVLHVGKGWHKSVRKEIISMPISLPFPTIPPLEKTSEKNSGDGPCREALTSLLATLESCYSRVSHRRNSLAASAAGRRAIISENPLQIAWVSEKINERAGIDVCAEG